jgi:uncharacterized membrane protein (DUF485 family)
MENESSPQIAPSPNAQAGPTSEELRRQRQLIIGITIVIVLFLILFIGTLLFLLNPNTPQLYVARVRDVFIIILALQSLVIGMVLVILMVQLARLTNLLQNEIKPILESTNETANTLRGTTTFLSDNLVEPVIKANEYSAGFRQLIALFGLSRRK